MKKNPQIEVKLMCQYDFSFVVPCYNSQHTIMDVINEIKAVVRPEDKYEIICVNDYSSDDVLKVLESIASSNKSVKVLSLARNFGQHNALMAGLSVASGEILVILDDDGQSPVDELYSLIDKIDAGADVVISTTDNKKHYNLLKKIGSKLNETMSNLLVGTPKRMNFVPLYAFKRFVCEELLRYRGPYTYMLGLLYRTSNSIEYVKVNHRNRAIGKTTYSLKKLISLWLNGFTAFSVKPLRIATVIGMTTACIGFLYGAMIVVQKLIGYELVMAGWSSLMAVILFLGGMIMIFLGLIGEYLGRIYLNINNTPQFVIKEKINI